MAKRDPTKSYQDRVEKSIREKHGGVIDGVKLSPGTVRYVSPDDCDEGMVDWMIKHARQEAEARFAIELERQKLVEALAEHEQVKQDARAQWGIHDTSFIGEPITYRGTDTAKEYVPPSELPPESRYVVPDGHYLLSPGCTSIVPCYGPSICFDYESMRWLDSNGEEWVTYTVFDKTYLRQKTQVSLPEKVEEDIKPVVHRAGHFPIDWAQEATDRCNESDYLIRIEFNQQGKGIDVVGHDGDEYAQHHLSWLMMEKAKVNPLILGIENVERQLRVVSGLKQANG